MLWGLVVGEVAKELGRMEERLDAVKKIFEA
jgi:hypothetical protein